MRVGPYEVTGTLGKGGMGVVYSARTDDGRAVALKVMQALQPDSRARFAREVEGLSRLDHPGVVGLLGSGTTPDGSPYLVMPLVLGCTLAERVRAEGPLPQDEAARLALELARALEHAHGQGVVHRDVKPSNVLLDREGRARLVDFGLARLLTVDDRISLTGEVVGTPAYMAPEQAGGERARADERTDVYGLGATLYEMLTGAPPLRGHSLIDLLNAVVTRAPARIASLRHDVDPALAAVCERCLEKDPAARFPTARALADALAAVSAARPMRSRRPALVVAPVVALLIVGAFFVVGALRDRSPREVEPGAALASPGELEKNLAAAEGALARGDLAVGLAAASRAVDQDARSAAAHGLLGQILLRWGDPAGALASLERAVALGTTVPDVLTARAQARLAVSDRGRALGAALEVVRLHPTLAAGHVEVGLARRALNDNRGALLALDRAVELAARDLDARRARANLRLFLADFTGALDDATVAVEVGGGRAEDRALRARIRLRADDLLGALEDAQQVIVLTPDDVKARRMLAALLAVTGDLAGSYAEWTEAVRQDPEHTDSRRERAMLLLALKRETEALGEVSEVLARRPDDGQALLLRGAIHERREEVVLAYEDLQRAVELLGPASRPVRQQATNDPLLQTILRAGGRFDHDPACTAWLLFADAQQTAAGAARACAKALELHPGCYEVHARRAFMWFRSNEYARAAADVRVALANEPTHSLANAISGLLAMREGRFDDAIAATSSAIAVDPRLTAAHAARGQARVYTGDARRGLEDIDAALALEPGLPIAHEARAEALRALGQPEAALAECQRALDAEPRGLGPRVVRGWLLLDAGDAVGARAEADHVIGKDPRNGRGYGLRAAAREALGDLEGARADCAQALSRTLLPPHRGEVEARLRRLGEGR